MGKPILALDDCNISVSGQVLDAGTAQPLSFVHVYIQELSDGTTTDEQGKFTLPDLCKGEYHFVFSHIGCEPVQYHVDIEADTMLIIVMQHHATSLGHVVISGTRDQISVQPSVAISRQYIEDNANENLATLLENQGGVHLIKNGSSIAKPVVQGLYGNRLAILNNGILQSGQQWGNDHSPEIDPYAADRVTVLKGTSAIAYGSNLGSVILVEPKRIEKEPHLHGQVNYTYETNGRGHTANTRLGKYSPTLAWKISGTLKRYGDRSAANYLLNNTGTKEANLALQLERSWGKHLFIDFYASTFNTTLGVLRGSQISTINDLTLAFDRSEPYFTEEIFSDSLEAPMQDVAHHFAKLRAKYYLADDKALEIVLAAQVNDRKEFDVRRSGRTDRPTLSLSQQTLNIELKYTDNLPHDWDLKIGNQQIFTDNTNNPETGILPLIPDYFSWRNGAYTTLAKKWANSNLDIGIRYDLELQSVATFSSTLPREVIRYDNRFHNVGALATYSYDLSSKHSLSINMGYATRNPAINELYSMGLHQGVSGIEEGDAALVMEHAWKTSMEQKWLPSEHFSFSALAYYQLFTDYIYLSPSGEIRPTIRGSFPVFTYEQTDASIYGVDITTQATIGKSIQGVLRYSYLRGQDRTNNLPLVYIPPNSSYASVSYRHPHALSLTDAALIDGLELELNSRYVFEQMHFVPELDYVDPPPAYHLLGMKLSGDLVFGEYKWRAFVQADNLLNITYRDYLNRLRYFADDLGLSITFGLNFKF